MNTAAPTFESLRGVGASAPESASSLTTRRAPSPSSRRPIQLLDFPDEILDQICRECREGDLVDSDFSFRDAKHLFPLSRTNRRLAAVAESAIWEYLPVDFEDSRTRILRLSNDPQLWRYVRYAFVDIDSPSLSLFFPNVLLNLVDLIITIPPLIHNTARIIPWRLTSILRQLPNLKALSLVPYQEAAGPVAFEDESFSFETSVPNLSILCMGYTLLGIEGSSKILDRLQVVGLDAGTYFSALFYGIEHVANLGLQLGEDLYGALDSRELPLDVAACTTRAALATAFPLVHEILAVLEETECVYLRLRHELSSAPAMVRTPSVHFFRDGANEEERWRWELYHPA
ncbi:hypothetical protein RQP46_001197 [Phenoliferia psychrophenolica]